MKSTRENLRAMGQRQQFIRMFNKLYVGILIIATVAILNLLWIIATTVLK